MRENAKLLYSQGAEDKKRRRKLFEARRKKTVQTENKEGIYYQSNLGVEAGINFVDAPAIADDHVQVDQNMTIVYFDLETTGLAKSDQILQIAAGCAEKEFNQYIT